MRPPEGASYGGGECSPPHLSGGSCPSRLPGEIQAAQLQSVRVTQLKGPTAVPSSQSLVPSSPPPPRRLSPLPRTPRGREAGSDPFPRPLPFPSLPCSRSPRSLFLKPTLPNFPGVCSPSLGSPPGGESRGFLSSPRGPSPAQPHPGGSDRRLRPPPARPALPSGGIRREPSTHRSLGVPSAESQGEQQEEATGARAQLHSPPPPGAPQPRRS